MKKCLYSAMIAVMVLSTLTGCEEKEDKGVVYFLNKDEETDDTWQDIAEEYTRQTNIEVKVVTAAPENYNLMLAGELDKGTEPTMFLVSTEDDLERFEDYCYDLSNTSFARELTTNDYNLYGEDGELHAVGYTYEGFGLITNKELLGRAGYSVEDIRSFTDLKRVAEDITERSEELGVAAFTSSGLEESSVQRFTEQLANLPLYYGNRDKGQQYESIDAAGRYEDNYKMIWDLYINNATCLPEEMVHKTLKDARDEFGNGEAVFYQNDTNEFSVLTDEYNMKPENLAMIPIYCGVPGEENAGLCLGTEKYLAVNEEAEEEDVEATLDFLHWVVSSKEGTAMLAKQFGPIPFENAGEFENVFLASESEAMSEKRYDIPWVYNNIKNDTQWKQKLAEALKQYVSDTGEWESVGEVFDGK